MPATGPAEPGCACSRPCGSTASSSSTLPGRRRPRTGTTSTGAVRWLEAGEAAPERLGDLDLLAVEVRAAIGRSWTESDGRAAAFRAARRFGDLLFEHGRPAEAQRAFE